MSKNIKKSDSSNIFLWWNLSDQHVQKQVKDYDNLNWKDSARKLSALLLIFSTVLSCLFVAFSIIEPTALIDASIFLFLSFFVWKGHRWALVGAMGIWTLGKFLVLSDALSSGEIPNLLSHFIWWSVYMHYFYLALRVELLRNKSSKK